MTPVHKLTIISLVGRTSSGKSTIGRKLARYLRTSHIEVSEVIRTLHSGYSSREELASTSKNTKEDPLWLGREIAKTIERRLETKGKRVVIVSGLRELEAVKHLRNNYNYFAFEVRAELPVRYERSIEDGKYFTADEFLRGEIRELDLGLEQVEDDAPFAIPTSPFTDPDKIVKATVKLLRKKGANLR